jgi:hypothetical protein
MAASFNPELGHQHAMIQEYERIQKLNAINWRSPPFILKIYENCKRVK